MNTSGVSLSWWFGFHAAAAGLISIDALVGRHHGRFAKTLSKLWVVLLAVVTLAFAAWIAISMNRQAALEFAGGYFLETSLSVDNLFVFILIFQTFHVCKYKQHQALFWGFAGAMLLRLLALRVGFSAFQHLRLVPVCCGTVLLYSSWRMFQGREEIIRLPAWLHRFRASSGSLLPAVVAMEVTDLFFATDSVPAVVSISHNLFVAYTSNVAAILMLRSLYSGLSILAERFQYLNYGVAVILGFVGVKMLAGAWLDVPITVSLLVIGMALGISAAASIAVRFLRDTKASESYRDSHASVHAVASGCKTPVCDGACLLR